MRYAVYEDDFLINDRKRIVLRLFKVDKNENYPTGLEFAVQYLYFNDGEWIRVARIDNQLDEASRSFINSSEVLLFPEENRLLLSEICERARSRGMTLATLEVRLSNDAAVRLYESFGFRQVAIRKGYYADNGEDAIVMLMELVPGSRF